MADFSTAGTPSISISDKPVLRPAVAEDTGRLKIALAEAFVEDPVFAWLMPDADSRLARLRRFFDVELRHLVIPNGRGWTSPALRESRCFRHAASASAYTGRGESSP
jgi:hypothetical protein